MLLLIPIAKLRRSICLAAVYCKQDFTLSLVYSEPIFGNIHNYCYLQIIIETSKMLIIADLNSPDFVYYQNDCPSLLKLCS